MRLIKKVGDWLDERLDLRRLIELAQACGVDRLGFRMFDSTLKVVQQMRGVLHGLFVR